jgi:hypothetical protein
MKELSYPLFVLALQDGTLASMHGRRVRCPTCKRSGGTAVIVRFQKRSYCPTCVPRDRTCARCRRLRDVTAFHAIATGQKPRVESYCDDCRRERALEQYHEKRRDPPPIARSKECSACGTVRPGSAFYRDGRYAGGLESVCKKCKAALWLEYVKTPGGREAFAAAQATYERKRARPNDAAAASVERGAR